jgi:predicted ATP-binding protein involved in virulence
MKLRRLKLSNYRGFKDDKYNFDDQFNVIAGINGTGKTSILDGLSVLLSRFVPKITPSRGGQKRFKDHDIYNEGNVMVVEMSLDCKGYPIKRYDLKYEREANVRELTPLTKAVRTEIANRYGYNKQSSADAAPLAVYFTTDRSTLFMPRKLPRAKDIKHDVLSFDNSFQQEVLPQAVAYLGALSNRRTSMHDFITRYPVMMDLSIESIGVQRRYFGRRAIDVIKEALKTFLPEFDDFEVQQDPPALIIKKSGIPLTHDQISHGERGFLALVIDLSRRLVLANPNASNPLVEGEGIVLVDEIELHLHPSWQRTVVENLKRTFPNIQFIVTTHSPFIIQSLRDDKLIYLTRENLQAEYADKSIEDIAEEIMGIEMPQKSHRYKRMMEEAEKYFRMLRDPAVTEDALLLQEQKLSEAAGPYSDAPAFHALLKLERETIRGRRDDTSGR